MEKFETSGFALRVFKKDNGELVARVRSNVRVFFIAFSDLRAK